MNTDCETKLRELVFKLVARKIGTGDTKSLAYKVILLTSEINRLYGVQVGEAMFFADDAGTFFFQYRNISVGVFDEEGNSVNNNTFLCDQEDLLRLLQELAEEE